MADADQEGSTRRPWLIAVVLMLGVVATALLLWAVPFSLTIISGADRNNQRDLAIAASGLEHWSTAIPDVARGSFIRGSAAPLEPWERDYRDGWQYRARQMHPSLGEYRIVYSVGTQSDCDDIKARISAREGRLPFVTSFVTGASGMLKVVDSFALDDIRALDTGAGEARSNADVRAYVGEIRGANVTVAAGDATPAGRTMVCYAIVIPLDRMLVIDQAAKSFSNFLVVDAQRKIVAQIGTVPLPVASLDGLVPQSSALVSTLAASLGQSKMPDNKPQKLGDSLDPVELKVQGRSYVAYVQPFFPPASFDACQPQASGSKVPNFALAVGDETMTVNATPPANGPPVKAAAEKAAAAAKAPVEKIVPPRGQCFVVGLMPRSLVLRQIVSPPLAILVVLGLALGIAIALLPSLRLILLGPAEAIGRIELICVVLGIPAAASLATLALIFAADTAMHRSAARDQAVAVAQASAARAGGELKALAAHAATMAGAPLLAKCPNDLGPDRPSTANASMTDPSPLVCLNDKLVCPAFTARGGLPVAETFTIITDRGRQVPGTRVIACRKFAGGRADVSGRDYFQRLRIGLPTQHDGKVTLRSGTRDYVVGQVLGIQDGINKTVVAFRIDDNRIALAAAVLPSLAAPVLPPPMSLMVVDTRDESLLVVIHPAPNHSSAERLAAPGEGGGALRVALRELAQSDRKAPVFEFTRTYDGKDQQFIAAPIAGSRLVVLVHYPLQSVDAQAAYVASRTLLTWATFSVLFGGAWLAWLVWTGNRGWSRLWPQEQHRTRYNTLSRYFAGFAALGLLVILEFAGIDAPGLLALLAGLLVRFAAAVMLHRRDVSPPVSTDRRFLTPETQRAYSRMLVILVLCLSVVPMAGFWVDARSYAGAQIRDQMRLALDGSGGAIERNARTLAEIRAAYGVTGRVDDYPGLSGVVQLRGPTATQGTDATSFARTLSDWSSVEPETPLPAECSSPNFAATDVVLCGNGGIHLPSVWRTGSIPPPLILVSLALLAAGLVALLVFVARRVLRALTGFGIAVDAVDLPSLCLTDLWGIKPPPNFATLNRKSLLVNAPFSLLDMLKRDGSAHPCVWPRVMTINVASRGTTLPPLANNSIALVTGIDLVIADTERRKAALVLIERLIAELEALGRHTTARLMILSTTAPLERILDAYERDGNTSSQDTMRENLRWARVFEDFAAYYFRPIEVTDGTRVDWDLVGNPPVSPDERDAIDAVLCEMRWVPPHVVNGVIGDEIGLGDAELDAGCLPVAPGIYHDLYRQPLIDWARSRNFVGPAAAYSYLRSQMIEYYQRRWSSSTHAERLIMHNLAFGRLVNMTTAIAFISLVRRGLIVLDPEPRLMNESFAMFVRQAEKLDTIADWQSELPSGAWVKARLPILLTIGGLALAGVVFAIVSGQQLTALIPLLAAGAPALLATVSRMVRSN